MVFLSKILNLARLNHWIMVLGQVKNRPTSVFPRKMPKLDRSFNIQCLKEKVTPESVFFSSSPIKSLY